MTKFTPQNRGALLERVAAGLSQNDACRAVGIGEPTLKTWLRRGRKETKGEYADFAKAISEARQAAAKRPDPLTEDEHRRLVAEAARKGSVAAMKLAWEMIVADRKPDQTEETPKDPFEGLDELAKRRQAVGA